MGQQAPPFQPAATFAGGSGGGFGTGGGFGSTGGFHTMRYAQWEEPSLIKLEPDPAPLISTVMPADQPSQFAPSTCANGVAHLVNKIRADKSGDPKYKAIVNDALVAPPIQPSDGGPMLVMRPEHFSFMRVHVPTPRKVLPPESFGQNPAQLWAPEERRSLLEFEKEKAMADKMLARDRHRQMRLIGIMQRRFPNGGVPSVCMRVRACA
eukprot:CAMPEP_0113675594 /NCGR_PEP_ID=MMETSP0038_2-20120614/8114_1 /TAXON_ID=2898 /ORGANISM="Cryptomonas paramecium" /LENGTH=208 /DNA_ID=CAMNT_0000592409 /DNA_START=90 /DNA_END=716 /DNA_ORIENTATION=- /assembly_acc=CAM_ASM_000170